jgi:hypothetical protein
MTTQVPQGQVQSSGAGGNVNSNNSLMHITVGPTALASKMIYQMLTMYLTILKSQSEQKNSFYAAQYAETKNQAKATTTAATMEALGLITSGVAMIGGAIASGVLNNEVGKEDFEATNQKMEDSAAEAKPLQEINKMQPEAASHGIGGDGDAPDNIQTRIDELKNGEFTDADGEYDKDTTGKAIEHMKAQEPAAYQDMNRRLNEQITQHTQNKNSEAQRLQSITVNRQVYSQMATQGAQALGQGGQAGFKVAQANNQKDVELNRTAASQSGQGSSELGQDMGKQYQNAMQALQALAAIRQSSETSNM